MGRRLSTPRCSIGITSGDVSDDDGGGGGGSSGSPPLPPVAAFPMALPVALALALALLLPPWNAKYSVCVSTPFDNDDDDAAAATAAAAGCSCWRRGISSELLLLFSVLASSVGTILLMMKMQQDRFKPCVHACESHTARCCYCTSRDTVGTNRHADSNPSTYYYPHYALADHTLPVTHTTAFATSSPYYFYPYHSIGKSKKRGGSSPR